eukprot:CAMPEP_0206428046 /NCGR_PEP_ID=MMETSP0324_2-20121206/5413_1 /ASSEMBLY_ACC=CAM_ASM_000836 /TAXON_ID=2866 /ORGANISM="Crypthecodinium cohnii, Strain Seligo" /LENGTH=453 /DNA_ID=CAMNT_0053893463 /DNA_START=155 /DNA_END=1516 /DNA_ORIENTATION=+
MACPVALIMMCLVAFFSYLTVGMLAPFLPQHMAAIGVDERWSGIIFAFYPIAVIATTPIANELCAKLGRPTLIGLGLITQAVAAFIFGVFNSSLLVLLFARFMQGCGASASNLAMFALVADLYPDTIGKVMGLNELFIGAGFSIGPLFGAMLYAQGGFPVPFVVCSVQMLIIGLLTPILRGIQVNVAPDSPPDGKESPKSEASSNAVARIWNVCTFRLLAPGGLLVLGTIVWGVIDSGFYTVHADHALDLGQGYIGLNLAAASAAYAIVGVFAGSMADSIGYGTTMLCGTVVVSSSLVLLGPLEGFFANLISETSGDENMQMVQCMYEFGVLLLLGVGQATALIPSLGAMKSAVPEGDPSATEACISVFNFFQQAGLVLGPLGSSALGDRYILGTTIIGAAFAIYALVMGPELRKCGRAVKDPLLRHESPRALQGSPGEFTSPGLTKARSQGF